MPGGAYAYWRLAFHSWGTHEQVRAVRFLTRRICFIRASRRSANTRAWSCWSANRAALYAAIYRLRERSLFGRAAYFRSRKAPAARYFARRPQRYLRRPEQAYALTGTAHIIAISGFNMAVLAGLITKLFTRKLGARRGGALILTLAFYTVLVGASASVLRAALMGSVWWPLGASISRRGSGLNSLLAVCLMLLVNPTCRGCRLPAFSRGHIGDDPVQRAMQARLQRWLRHALGRLPPCA